jgi:hypothetical protein
MAVAQIEIFDQREVDGGLNIECDAEALQIIEELGLRGQTNSNKTRVRYPSPNAEQIIVLEGLFPAATKVEEYAADCIPIRVLKEIRSYKAENPNHVLIIRHAAPAIMKDPVLLAYANESNRNYDWYARDRCANGQWQDFRIIARWGDALDDWATLAKRATKALTEEYCKTLQQIVAQIEMQRAFFRAGGELNTARNMPTINGLSQLGERR